MTMAKLNTLSAREAALRIAKGEITCEALVRDCLARIAERDRDAPAARRQEASARPAIRS